MKRTINLYDSLEALYYFGTEYWDGGANELSDMSGHGRHADAQGGVAVSSEGPDAFGAASFDGTDDVFTVDNSAFLQDVPFSFAVTFLQEDTTRNHFLGGWTGLAASGNGFAIHNSFGRERVEFMVNSGDDSIKLTQYADTDRWYTAIARYDGTVARMTTDKGTYVGKGGGSYDSPTSGAQPQAIGANLSNDSNYLNGKIAFVGAWSRILTDTETQAILDMTGPRRTIA
jgi:hypothetical protein